MTKKVSFWYQEFYLLSLFIYSGIRILHIEWKDHKVIINEQVYFLMLYTFLKGILLYFILINLIYKYTND